MKRVIIAIFTLLVTGSSVNAQIFVGGSLGLNFGSGKSSVDNFESSSSSYGFSISPQVGYYLNDDWTIGVSGSLGNSWHNGKSANLGNPASEREYKSIDNKWGINVFGRYRLMGLVIKDLALLIEGSIGVQGSSNKYTVDEITTKYPGSTIYGVNARPALSYKLLNKLDVLAYCNFLTIGYSYTTDNKQDAKKSEHHAFNLGVNTFSNLNIGFIYKF